MSCRHWRLNDPFCCVHHSRDSQCFSVVNRISIGSAVFTDTDTHGGLSAITGPLKWLIISIYWPKIMQRKVLKRNILIQPSICIFQFVKFQSDSVRYFPILCFQRPAYAREKETSVVNAQIARSTVAEAYRTSASRPTASRRRCRRGVLMYAQADGRATGWPEVLTTDPVCERWPHTSSPWAITTERHACSWEDSAGSQARKPGSSAI